MAAYGAEEIARAGIDSLAKEIRTNPNGVARFIGLGKNKRKKKRNPKKAVMLPRVTQSAVANNYRVRNTALRVRNISGITTIRNTNQVTDLSSTSDFQVQTFQINPGLSKMFPALRRHANGFQSYKFTKLVLRYTPVCGTQFSGDISMAFATDANDPEPINMRELAQYPTLQSGSIREEMVMRIPNKATKLFTRAGEVPNTDIKTYDMGKLFVATDLASDIIKIGRLWIEYEVQLFTPKPLTCPAGRLNLTAQNTPGVVPNTDVQILFTTSEMFYTFPSTGVYFLSGRLPSKVAQQPQIFAAAGSSVQFTTINSASGFTGAEYIFSIAIEINEPGAIRIQCDDATFTAALLFVSEGSPDLLTV